MAGFEVIVRPAVLPSIRPPLPRVLPPEDDPEKGVAVLSGSGGRLIDLPYNWSYSVSRQIAKETKVQESHSKVSQKGKDGKINKNNFIEVARMKRMRLDTPDGATRVEFRDPPEADNVEILADDVTR